MKKKVFLIETEKLDSGHEIIPCNERMDKRVI